MPFYQMLCIASHFREYKHIKDLVTMSAKHIMDQGGVVRNIEYWGTQTLPQPMRRHRQVYTIGDYWTMYFDTSPHGLKSLTGVIRRDPRVIRWTMLKQGGQSWRRGASTGKDCHAHGLPQPCQGMARPLGRDFTSEGGLIYIY
ncbi:hypothetical protein EDC04DRAFT_1871086 [Pisolithus marmoratus]|nr:hypothetical protein EDC04DRAFT_1871086 [Pisolithus marmoratus]